MVCLSRFFFASFKFLEDTGKQHQKGKTAAAAANTGVNMSSNGKRDMVFGVPWHVTDWGFFVVVLSGS